MIAVISIFAAITGSFVLYKIRNSKQHLLIPENRYNTNGSIIFLFLNSKIVGFLIMGFIPGILAFTLFSLNPADAGLKFGDNNAYWYLFGIPVIIVWINYFLANNPATIRRYPEMRFAEWNKAKFAALIFGWTIYLLGYEFLFRGLLLFSVYHSFGLFVSLVVNTIIYSLVHFYKGKSEMLGAIPFGVLLCSLAFLTNSIILPFLVHLSLALSTDFFTIHYNQDMKFVKS